MAQNCPKWVLVAKYFQGPWNKSTDLPVENSRARKNKFSLLLFTLFVRDSGHELQGGALAAKGKRSRMRARSSGARKPPGSQYLRVDRWVDHVRLPDTCLQTTCSHYLLTQGTRDWGLRTRNYKKMRLRGPNFFLTNLFNKHFSQIFLHKIFLTTSIKTETRD